MANTPSSLRASLLPALDTIRTIGAQLDLRRYDITVRVNTWSGTIVGEGTKTTVDTPLRVGGQRPRVKQVTQQQVIMSAGLYQDQDLIVGPLTPSFPGGGTSVSAFDPANAAPNVELLFIVSGGPNSSAGGDFYKLVSQDATRNLHFTITIRRTGQRDG